MFLGFLGSKYLTEAVALGRLGFFLVKWKSDFSVQPDLGTQGVSLTFTFCVELHGACHFL